MSDKKWDFLRDLQAAFRGEAAEHLQAMATGLIDLEHAPDGPRRTEIVSVVFREAHSLKGAARAVDRKDIEAVCQTVEDIFSRWRAEGVQLTPPVFDGLQHAISSMQAALASSTPCRAGSAGDEIREVHFHGARHLVTAGRRQMLNLLLSTFGIAVERNRAATR
jgi:chemotaxis protein histidine kinase CheA